MKKFLTKIFYFLGVPSLCWIAAETLLPPTFFTFRHYEALRFDSSAPHIAATYPNVNSTMDAVGDLCHHTKHAIVKKEHWITDRLGYRNNAFVARPDVVFIGDSYLQGCTLSQDEILANRVAALLPGIRIYNMAPGNFNRFDYLVGAGIIKKPKAIVFEIAERNLPEPLAIGQKKTKRGQLREQIAKLLEETNLAVPISKVMKAQSVAWLRARVHGAVGNGIPGTNPDMFFLRGRNNKHNAGDLEATAKTIASYQKYCDARGIKLIFLPMPDKETVYSDMVRFDAQPDYLARLDGLLKQQNIRTINTLAIYNTYRRNNNTLLYHYDDTHWNANAVKLVATQTAGAIIQTLHDN